MDNGIAARQRDGYYPFSIKGRQKKDLSAAAKARQERGKCNVK